MQELMCDLHLARRVVWAAWHWAWGAANPSNRRWRCRCPPDGSSCQKLSGTSPGTVLHLWPTLPVRSSRMTSSPGGRKMSPRVKTCKGLLSASRNASSPFTQEHHRLDASTILLGRSSTCYPPLLLSWLKCQWQGRRSRWEKGGRTSIIMTATSACNCLVTPRSPTTNSLPHPFTPCQQLRNRGPIAVSIPRAHNSLWRPWSVVKKNQECVAELY